MAHPINELMLTAMQSIKEMVDVNTIVGDAVTTPDGMVVIPISKVAFGFASGGGEYDFPQECISKKNQDEEGNGLPFAGGSGAGISISPVAFMVVGQGQIKLMSLHSNTTFDRVIDMAPEILNRINEFASNRRKKEE